MRNKKVYTRITTFVCFDIETTGLDPSKDKIIEIGALKVKEGKIVERFNELINPGMKLPGPITKLTGITDAMLEHAELEETVVERFIEFVGENIVIGHNVKFDYSFIKTAAHNNKLQFDTKVIDTLYLCRRFHSELPSRSLEHMCKHYGIINKHAHRALDDVKATTMLYVNLTNAFYDISPEAFAPKSINYKIKKVQPITMKQKNYLIDLIKYHNIEYIQPIDTLTQNEASRIIDRIILEKGRII